MNKWPVEQGWDFTVGLLGKVEGNKGLAYSLGSPEVTHSSSDSLSYCVIGHPALSRSLDKFALTSKWRILSHCQHEWLCPSSPKGTAT